MTDPANTRWFDNTSLDFSLLDPSLQSKIAGIASTTQNFYEKYIITNNQVQLKNELETILTTTEEYAANLTASIFDYFVKYYIPNPSAEPTNAPPENPTFSGFNTTPPSATHVLDAISKSETIALIQQANLERIQAFTTQLQEHRVNTLQEIGAAKEETKNEITNLKKEVAHITDVLHRLADSFNQLRLFVEEYTRNNPPRPAPVVQAPAPNMGYPPPQPINPYPNPPAYAPYPGAYPPNPPQPPINVSRQGQAYPNYGPPANDLDMIHTTALLTKSPDVVRIDRKACLWMKKNEARVILDYIVLDSCVACTWKIHNINKNDGSVRIGFIPDSLSSSDEITRDQGFELRNDGYLVYRKNKEKCQQFSPGDVIRVELNPGKFAVFFLNDQALPFRIINIPQLCKFYVCGSGQNTCVEATNLLVIPAITEPPNRAQLRELDGNKK